MMGKYYSLNTGKTRVAFTNDHPTREEVSALENILDCMRREGIADYVPSIIVQDGILSVNISDRLYVEISYSRINGRLGRLVGAEDIGHDLREMTGPFYSCAEPSQAERKAVAKAGEIAHERKFANYYVAGIGDRVVIIFSEGNWLEFTFDENGELSESEKTDGVSEWINENILGMDPDVDEAEVPFE